MSAPTKKTGTRGNSKKRPLNPPTQHVELPKPEDVAAQKKPQPYPPTVQTYAYQPKDGSEPILLALNGFEPPDKLWHFDTAQLPPLTQTWKWMDRANIPKDIQRRALSLPDAEYFGMFDEWFEVMKQFAKAGPKGVLSAGK